MSNQENKDISRESARQNAARMVEWLREKQARDILALDVRGINSCSEALVIASAVNVRHAQTLADWTLEKLSGSGLEVLGVEGYHPGYWILLDLNEVILHIFQLEYREFYNLDGLWRDAPRISTE